MHWLGGCVSDYPKKPVENYDSDSCNERKPHGRIEKLDSRQVTPPTTADRSVSDATAMTGTPVAARLGGWNCNVRFHFILNNL